MTGTSPQVAPTTPRCPKCKGSRRLLMASGRTEKCECCCITCGGSGYYEGKLCHVCKGSGQEPRCTSCALPLSSEEVDDSASNGTEPLCNVCATVSRPYVDTSPPPAPVPLAESYVAPIEHRVLVRSGTLTASDLRLAYSSACFALHCDPADSVLEELVSMTGGALDLLDAINAMRTAAKYDRVRSALTLLHDRHRDRARRDAAIPRIGAGT
jgi:hypothetical protein